MKRSITTILCMLTMAGSSLAQTVSIPQPDSVNVYQYPWNGYPQLFYLSFSYDDNGVLIRSHKECSDTVTWWLEDFEYLYDENLLCQQRNRSLDAYDGQFFDHWKTEYGRTDGKLSSETTYYFNPYGPSWQFRDSHLYYYDSLGRPAAETFKRLNKVNNVRYEYGEGVSVKHIGYYTDSVWTNLCTVTRTFSDDGRPLTSLRVQTGGNTLLTTYSYNEHGRIAEVLTEVLSNGEFVRDRRGVYEPNEEGWPVVVRFEKWDGQEWVDGYCHTFAYGQACYYDRDFFIYWEDFLKRQDETMSVMVNIPIHRLEIHYTDTPAPTYETKKQPQGNENVTVQPNPTSGKVTVTGEGIREVEVHNLLGQRVASMEGHDTASLTLSLEGLPQGVYLVSVRLADGKRCEKKLVVQQ